MSDTIYEYKATVFKALSHPARLQILEFLMREQQCACDMAPLLNIEQSALSRHIAILKEAGIVRTWKEGVRLYVKIADRSVERLLSSVDDIVRCNIKSRQHILFACETKTNLPKHKETQNVHNT